MNATKIDESARRLELAAIHVGKKQLGLDDETYRSMLWALARVNSAKDLDWTGRKRVLEHMRASGFKPIAGKAGRTAGRPRNMATQDRGPLLAKIEAMLADAGRAWAYADGTAKRMFGIERVAFLDPGQLHKLVAALVYDQQRRQRAAAKAAAEAAS